KKLAAEVDWTQGGVTGRRKRNIRRLNELFRLRDKLRKDKAQHAQRLRAIEIEQLGQTQASKVIVEFKHVTKCFQQEKKKIPILEEFNLRIVRGDRIGIIGKNGSGKSTFIKLLTGELEPDSGFIRRGKTMELAYFDQSRSQLNPNKTLWDTLCPNGGDYVFLGNAEKPRPIHVCGYLKNFLFDPRGARDRVSTLSGGQQNRLMLAKLLANPGNVLILDEPTNDLDMDTLDMLQEMLAEYEGTLLIVSHDRDFLDRTVTEVLAFEGDANIQAHIGGYSDYLAAKKAAEMPAKQAKAERSDALKPAASGDGDVVKIKPKMTFKLVHELEKLPEKIATLEAEIIAMQEALADADLYTRDPKKFDACSQKLATAQHDLEKAELRWLELEEMRAASGG
ncbi:MAG: ATP-binding cassette domain-containing protein, partial [Rickettsiales bacterium]|nr:ATP-binding cassette domain-containing protein [Rickettsiales bacterium]